MRLFNLQTALSFLAHSCDERLSLSLRKISLFLKKRSALLLLAISCGQAYAYTVIQGPSALETSLIAATTNQYNATLTVNPFFSGTYQIELIAPNPNYNPPVSNQDLLDALVTVDSYTYTSGWADGESYQEFKQWNVTASYGNLCNGATNFNLVQTTTGTFDQGTCQDVVGTIANIIFNLQADTPTVVPGNWQ
jgi:hypothetical protein